MASRSWSEPLAVVLGLLLLSRGAGAEAPATASAGPERAAELVAQGIEERRQGHEAEALASFEAAYALDPLPRTRAQMGLAAKSLRQDLLAERCLDEALAARSDPWIVEHAALLEAALAFVVARRGRLDVDPGSGNAAEHAPLPVRSDAAHVAEPPHSAPHPIPAPERRGDRTLSYVLAGGAGLALGAGTYFGLRTLALKQTLERICPTPRCPTSEGVEVDRSARQAALYSTLGFGAGAVLAAGAVYAWIVSGSRPPPPRVIAWTLVPLGTEGVGAVLRFSP